MVGGTDVQSTGGEVGSEREEGRADRATVSSGEDELEAGPLLRETRTA